MKKIVPWLERQRRGKGRNHNPKKNLVKGERRMTCPESSAFTVMNSSTMPRSVQTIRKTRSPHEEKRVRLRIHSSVLILLSLHA